MNAECYIMNAIISDKSKSHKMRDKTAEDCLTAWKLFLIGRL